jgi:hypothetical protein
MKIEDGGLRRTAIQPKPNTIQIIGNLNRKTGEILKVA